MLVLLQALEKYDTTGVQLIFEDDYETWWGPGWEFDNGLKYTKVRKVFYDHNMSNAVNI